MKRFVCGATLLLSAIACVACRKPYDPGPISTNSSYLVVDGVINSSSTPTNITLYRTVKLTAKTNSKPVLNAIVTVEGDNGSTYTLTDDSLTGNYSYNGLNLDATHKYRLRIKTTDNNKEYLSDFVPVKITPPIDSIGYTIRNNGLQLYVNSHDATNSTRYYRWSYEEGWEFHSEYLSEFYTDGTQILPRSADQEIFNCYMDLMSNDIVLGSSAKLSSDIIYQNPLLFIPSTSEKLEYHYGIVLKEYALTSDAYAFWNNMRTNSEKLGSIFDPQPSNINGNIHCLTNPSETVIGYVSAGTVQMKTRFVYARDMPVSWVPITPYTCQLDTFLFVSKNGTNEVAEFLIPIPPAQGVALRVLSNNTLVGYSAMGEQCLDCTLRGVRTPPAFFPAIFPR